MMKTIKSPLIAFGLIVATPLVWSGTAIAGNPDHVQQLLETNACMNCDLSGADLSGAHLIGADLRNANLSGTNLNEANLEGADLTGANLQKADLRGAMVTNASLNRANLTAADFAFAKLYDVDVTGATVDDMNIQNAEIYNTGIGIGGGDYYWTGFRLKCDRHSLMVNGHVPVFPVQFPF